MQVVGEHPSDFAAEIISPAFSNSSLGYPQKSSEATEKSDCPTEAKRSYSNDDMPSAFGAPSPPKKRKRARTAASEVERWRRERGKLGVKPQKGAVQAQQERLLFLFRQHLASQVINNR